MIPKGWIICDGKNGTPDLRDKFVLKNGQNNYNTLMMTSNPNEDVEEFEISEREYDEDEEEDIHIAPLYSMIFIMKAYEL